MKKYFGLAMIYGTVACGVFAVMSVVFGVEFFYALCKLSAAIVPICGILAFVAECSDFAAEKRTISFSEQFRRRYIKANAVTTKNS